MDEHDKASELEDLQREIAIQEVRRNVWRLPYLGYCYYCSEATEAGRRFCDEYCREDYETEQLLKKIAGR
jgi:hypothetical protein